MTKNIAKYLCSFIISISLFSKKKCKFPLGLPRSRFKVQMTKIYIPVSSL